MKKYRRCDKSGKYLSLILAFLNQRREKRSAGRKKNLLNAQNTENSVSAIRDTEIFISTSSDEADKATKLPKVSIIPLI